VISSQLTYSRENGGKPLDQNPDSDHLKVDLRHQMGHVASRSDTWKYPGSRFAQISELDGKVRLGLPKVVPDQRMRISELLTEKDVGKTSV
jgi:hypothetical protein